MEALQQLAYFVQDFSLDQVSEDVIHAARMCVLDSVGSALGAARGEGTPELTKNWMRFAAGSTNAMADVWGQGIRADMMSALLLNGMLGHALELDDVHTGSKSHVGTVIVQTAWTVADAMGLCGRQMLEAVIVGYEVMARTGMGMDVTSNRKRGWHTTGIIGTLGAAAAAARLLGLTREETTHALGIAAMQSAGLWGFLAEGATCKRLSPGRAAANGLTAAILAQGGMTGPVHALDAQDGGLYRAVSDAFDMAKLTDGLGVDYAVMHIDKKPYPCCRTTHHAIDAGIAFHEEGIDTARIQSIEVETYEVGVLQCGFTKYPESPVEAKFSIPFTLAVGLTRGHVKQQDFCVETLQDPEVRRLAQHTSVVADPMFSARYPKRWGSRTKLFMNNGECLEKQIDDMSGSIKRPLSEKQEKDKFIGLAETAFETDRVLELMDAILRIEDLSVLPSLR